MYITRWDNGAIKDAGAVSWGSGTSGVSGAVSIANSSLGEVANEHIFSSFRSVPLTLDNTNHTFSIYLPAGGKPHVGSQDTGFPIPDFFATVVESVLKVDVLTNRGSDVRVTRDVATSEYVVRSYDGAVLKEEFRFAIATVTNGLLANLGDGADRFDASGVSVATTILAGDGNDSIIGSAGDDSIAGGAGNDFINGFAGSDQASGGQGNDTIVGVRSVDVVDHFTKITSGINGGPALSANSHFGSAVASLGDVDGDGVNDLAVGSREAPGGTVRVLFMNANGTVKNSTLIGSDIGGGPPLAGDAQFGAGMAGLGDFDGDGVPDLAVGDPRGNRGHLLLLNADGTIKDSTTLMPEPFVSPGYFVNGFGSSIASLGDLDGDGIGDLAIGAPNSGYRGYGDFEPAGAIEVALLNADGSVKRFERTGWAHSEYAHLGTALTSLGDIDGDGVTDLAASKPGDSSEEYGGKPVVILLMNSDGTLKHGIETNQWGFGFSMASVGDLDGNGVADAVSASYSDTLFGELKLLLLNSDGSARDTLTISGANGGPLLTEGHSFGAVTALGDLDGDGALELAVGTAGDDSAGTDAGAVYVLSLNPFSASVNDGVLTINALSSRGTDVRVTRDAARSQFVVRNYHGAVIAEEFRFATSSVTRGLVANLGGGADRFDASGVSLATTIRGGGGDDSIVGSSGNDTIDGGLGDDHLNGKAGNDRVFGGLGNDVILGGAGDDSLSGDAGNDELWGTAGVDSLDGGEGIDSLDGGASASIIRDDVAGTVVLRNTGYQTARGDKVVTTSISRATLTGSAGADRIDTSRVTSGRITILGGSGNDTMLGGQAIETFFGEAGDDSLQAGAGNDTLSGGSGNDRLDGGSGSNGLVESADANLTIRTVNGVARLTGLGTDTLVGSFTTVEFTGGDGNNLVDASAFAGRATLNGGGGHDDLRGTPNADLLIGGAGNDLLTGNTGNDSLNGDAGVDDLRGGLGNDLLSGGTEGYLADLLDGGAGTDRLVETVENVSGFASIIGLEFKSSFYADPEMLTGIEVASLQGIDPTDPFFTNKNIFDARQSAIPVSLDGGAGDDRLFGSPFNDTIRGGLGDDVLSGGAGNDVISGDGGLDTQFESADADFTVSGRRITSSAIGNDSVSGIGSIVLLGGAGNNRLNTSAATVSVTLVGAGGNDTLIGGHQADVLIGGDPDDFALGTDSLIGNAGADTFDNDPADTRVIGVGDIVTDDIFLSFLAGFDWSSVGAIL